MGNDRPTKLSDRRVVWGGISAMLLILLALLPVQGVAQDGEQAEVTFTEDVYPVIQENCVACHREGGVGPMVLQSYDDVREWAPMVKMMVSSGEMPPYHYDRDVGIQDLEHDMRLSEDEIQTIVKWVDQGARQGDPELKPPPRELPDLSEWKMAEMFGPPDVVIPAKPFTVPADGGDLWWEPLVEIPTEEDRYIKAIEVKPSVEGRTVVHHANTSLFLPTEEGLEREGGRFTEYAAGKLGEIIPDGAGRVLPAEGYVRWSIHYYPMGERVEEELTELAFWLHPEDYEPEYMQDLDNYRLEGDLLIPPHGKTMVQGFHSFDHPVRIDSYQPHGHTRLRGAMMEIYYPETGEREVVATVSNWNNWWQHSHIFEEDSAPLIPAGAVMILTHWYDNTAENPWNPDPEVWAYRGQRTGDEMSHDWISVSHLSEEQYEEIKSEREEDRIAGADR